MRLRDDSDRSWERYGRDDPYFGVLSDARFRRDRLDDEAREVFFASGRDHLARIEADIARCFARRPGRRRALDFGCGVGRLVVDLASRFEAVLGLDVSPSMLAEAERNCAARGIPNARFALSDDALSAAEDEIDFAHSCLVLQHIETRRGLRILDALMRRMAPGGVVALQFFSHSPAPPWRRTLVRAQAEFVPLHWAANLARGRRWNEPLMQMHLYPLGEVARLAAAHGLHEFHGHVEPSGNTLFLAQKAA